MFCDSPVALAKEGRGGWATTVGREGWIFAGKIYTLCLKALGSCLEYFEFFSECFFAEKIWVFC